VNPQQRGGRFPLECGDAFRKRAEIVLAAIECLAFEQRGEFLSTGGAPRRERQGSGSRRRNGKPETGAHGNALERAQQGETRWFGSQ
jgi:hypothetical protein